MSKLLLSQGDMRGFSQALYWSKEVAKHEEGQWSAMACYHVGAVYHAGRGVAQSYKHARMWLEQALALSPVSEPKAGSNHELMKRNVLLVLEAISNDEKANGIERRVCNTCSAVEKLPKKLKTCRDCKITYYCDGICQKKNWKKHKKECKKIKDEFKTLRKQQAVIARIYA